MKYQYENVIIPQDKRELYNSKILTIVQSALNNGQSYGFSQSDVFNSYTGNGGLHGLDFKNYGSFAEYTKQKKEIELGQFFTPPPLCELITSLFPVTDIDLCADLSFGSGNFFNSLPNESNIYGTEIDTNAYTIAKYLYPNANIENKDIRDYKTQTKVDYIFGNPPFNLRWKVEGSEVTSQYYFCEKAYDCLKPLGVLAMIIPDTWLKDTHFYSGLIEKLNKQFSFLCQFAIPSTHLQYGWKGFPTKVIIFAKNSVHKEAIAYNDSYIDYESAKVLINDFITNKRRLRAKLQSELMGNVKEEFEYKVKKYLYEIKTHKALKPHYTAALSYLDKLKTQEVPQWIRNLSPTEQAKEWAKICVTENKVLAYMKRIMRLQSKQESDKSEYVLTKYGVKLKAYSHKAQLKISNETKFYHFTDIILNDLNMPTQFAKVINRKRALYENISQSFKDMQRCETIDKCLKDFRFYSNGKECSFTDIQFTDLGLILQKRYAALNWSPGCGKTAAGYAFTKFYKSKNTFVISPAIAIQITWTDFLTEQKESFIRISELSDISKIKPNDYVIMSTEMLVKYKKQIRKFIKKQGKKITLLFDESDEITNRESKRSKAAFDCFKDVKYKLLTTGTLTRNKISEIYAQMELLYNNSINMLCECEYKYEERRDSENQLYIKQVPNKHVNKPFSAYNGLRLFSACFNPSKASVFGVRKQNQDIYNEEHLRGLISKMVITRSFKEIAGDKYTIHSLVIHQSNEERELYRKILNEFHTMRTRKNDNARKDSMLAIIQQLNMLIECTSTPHKMKNSTVTKPVKALKILKMIRENNEKIIVGCTSLVAVNSYKNWIKEEFEDRQLFVITGSVPLENRKEIIANFEATNNGILVCTQQSLRASVNIPSCNLVIMESKQWNIPKMEQFYFRAVRFNSLEHTNIYFISYYDTIEMNLLALIMAKEKLNDYIKTLEIKMTDEIYEDFGIDLDILDSILEKVKDKSGKVTWGSQNIS